MSILDYFKHKEDSAKIRKNTKIYGVYKEVLYEGEISDMDYYSMLTMLNPFNRKQYVFPCFFLNVNDAMALRNAYTSIKKDGERYLVFEETYNDIFGNGQSPFKIGNPQLYRTYDEFVAERKSEYRNNSRTYKTF